MEEILASIRRIIADEDPADSAPHAAESAHVPPAYVPPPRTTPPPEPMTREPPSRDEDIDSMLARIQAAPRQSPPEQPLAVERGPGPLRTTEDADERDLMSPATAAAVDSAFEALAQNTRAPAPQAREGRTLEEVVTELLRPMLKTWLDENLPELVERLVQAEIERVARK
jgi:cell pole-organizing protein PopZ